MPIELENLIQTPRVFEIPPIFLGTVSPGAGTEASYLYGRFKSLEGLSIPGAAAQIQPVRLEAARPGSSAAPQTVPAAVPSIEESLFQNRARLKVMTSTVAMHLSDATRQWLFDALDELLDPEVWHEEDALIDVNSFGTYLRLLTHRRDVGRASLGVSNGGNLLAAWVTPDHRLTMEFLPSDQVRWALSHGTGELRELAAGQCGLRRLTAVLSPYDATTWFGDADANRC